eukprot:CAMPEP_0174296706 /NCGR_PEP_ID=MMETSP0809-20121228/48704_1 /TAXON_ID=73025 ORGANISM="Eutreptiella gymnastica-like, Strain CCMP1594" /NCGR_SAMPLE_ID=MMETSP0809 /ASSEMBLY_ACC=CAM_ASM_000658 /LENGTH=34 /DNA_ID= /DNA_START= /DNA_END= /DNA_ORIENTATION=
MKDPNGNKVGLGNNYDRVETAAQVKRYPDTLCQA